MVVPELEKLAEDEMPEFLRLYGTLPEDLTNEDHQRLGYFASIVDFDRYDFEVEREKAAAPQELGCDIIDRAPYRLETAYGELTLPDELVPEELKRSPGDNYHDDSLFAMISANLDTGVITSFVFKEYLRRYTAEELAEIPTLDSLPEANWPRIE